MPVSYTHLDVYKRQWLVHHLNRNVNVVVLLREAGLVTTKALTLLLPHLSEPDPAQMRRRMADVD